MITGGIRQRRRKQCKPRNEAPHQYTYAQRHLRHSPQTPSINSGKEMGNTPLTPWISHNFASATPPTFSSINVVNCDSNRPNRLSRHRLRMNSA